MVDENRKEWLNRVFTNQIGTRPLPKLLQIVPLLLPKPARAA